MNSKILSKSAEDFFPGVGGNVQAMEEDEVFPLAAGQIGQLSIFELDE
jgi:hypothetical protein